MVNNIKTPTIYHNTTDPRALQVALYNDLEVCNPLGSKTKVYKPGKYILSHDILST